MKIEEAGSRRGSSSKVQRKFGEQASEAVSCVSMRRAHPAIHTDCASMTCLVSANETAQNRAC